MKLNLYLTSILLGATLMGNAQISLDATMAPAVNSIILYHDANVPPGFSYGTSGTANTWDFSTITPAVGQEDTVYFADPASVPGSGAFPTATHATYEGGDGSINIIEINSSSLTFLGFIGDLIGTGTPMALAANPPASTMVFPFTLGSAFNGSTYIEIYTTGAAVGQPSLDSIHLKNTLMLDASVVASGDMILPSGTLQALLERRVSTSIDSVWGKGLITGGVWTGVPGFPTTSTDSAYYWYTDQSLEHYAHALYDSSGLHDVHYYKSTMTTGIKNPSTQSKQLNVYPNPTQDFLGIKGLNLPASEWTITNMTGQQVLNGNYDLNKIDIRSLPQGTYYLRLTTPSGEKHDVKFVKQ